MTEIQPFSFNGFEVRTVVIDGEPWFVGRDVALLLGYANPSDAIGKHVPPNHRNTIAIRDGIPGNPNQVVINEAGVWRLVMKSNAPHAERVQEWVTGEVLPSIRKTGFAGNPGAALDLISDDELWAVALKRADRKLRQIEAERDAANARLAIVAPKVKLADDFLNADALIPLMKAKRDLREAGLGWHHLIKADGRGLLQQLGWVTGKRKEASADGLDNGYVAMVPTGEYLNPWGEMITNYTVMLTREGFAWLVDYLRQDRPAISA